MSEAEQRVFGGAGGQNPGLRGCFAGLACLAIANLDQNLAVLRGLTPIGESR